MVKWAIDSVTGSRRTLQARERPKSCEIVIYLSCGGASLDDVVAWLTVSGFIGDRKGAAGAQSAPAPLLVLREGAI